MHNAILTRMILECFLDQIAAPGPKLKILDRFEPFFPLDSKFIRKYVHQYFLTPMFLLCFPEQIAGRRSDNLNPGIVFDGTDESEQEVEARIPKVSLLFTRFFSIIFRFKLSSESLDYLV